jgi:hypothetical protein
MSVLAPRNSLFETSGENPSVAFRAALVMGATLEATGFSPGVYGGSYKGIKTDVSLFSSTLQCP